MVVVVEVVVVVCGRGRGGSSVVVVVVLVIVLVLVVVEWVLDRYGRARIHSTFCKIFLQLAPADSVNR